ncbi:MAG TPA: cytochrome c oxidase assembly protein [Candidatus Binatia bacterium]|nr:cytochrome c oxidase assembly protein [Candidatus Binatia bacterium]
MSPTAQAVLASWTFPPGIVLTLVLTALLYVHGSARLRAQMPARFPWWRMTAFLTGLVTVLLAVASPLDAFAALLLQAHMVQHLLLIMVAPPLLLLGAPAMPLLRGLPAGMARGALGPFLASPTVERIGARLVHPVVAWLALAVVTWGWHVPAAYELALRSTGWHAVEHASFLVAALLFWWPVVQPWPSRAWWPRWAMVPYLLLADVQNTVLAGFLVFAERVLYAHYTAVPRLGGLSALDDQAAAGAIMWVPGSIAFLVPAAMITWSLLSPTPRPAAAAPRLRLPRTRPFDVLALPVVGRLLRSRWARPVAQGAMLVVAAAVVVDGLLGPTSSPMNLAGVLPWTYWRGGVVIGLLIAGNLFCFACPFTLPRALARRLGGARRPWPRALRSKWIAVGLLVAFFAAYELLSPWDSPRWTAWLVVAYFAVAFTVDARWSGASFCRWVCPIGQFQFVQSLVSPLEVRVRQPQACATCTTHDCLRGNATQRGCELDLFLPTKTSNLDCTFCLDCVRACPHDNIGLLVTAPGAALAAPRRRLLRPDTTALVLVFVGAAFASAAAMVAPVTAWQRAMGIELGVSPAVVAAAMVLLAVGVLPVLARFVAPASALRARFALALVPLGAAMWAAHFGFHLFAGLGTALPVLQRMVGDPHPDWAAGAAMALDPSRLLRLELLLLDAGLVLTLILAWRIARDQRARPSGAFGLAAPWATVALVLWLGGVWTVMQPMEMRGTMAHPGMMHP